MKELRTKIAAKIFTVIIMVFIGGIFIVSGLMSIIQIDIGLYNANKVTKGEFKQIMLDEAANHIAYSIDHELLLDDASINDKIGYEVRNVHGEKILSSSNLKIKDEEFVKGKAYVGIEGKQYEAIFYFKDIKDCGFSDIHMMATVFEYAYNSLYIAPIICIISAILLVLLLSFWVYSAGMTQEGVKGGFVEKIPFDLLTASCFIIALIVSILGMEIINNPMALGIWFQIFVMVISYLVILGVILLFLRTLTVRIRLRILIKNTLIYKIAIIIKRIFTKLLSKFMGLVREIPFVWKYAVVIITTALIMILIINTFMYMYFGIALLLSIIIMLIAITMLKVVIDLNKIKYAANKLASGDILYKMNLKGMKGDIKVLAEDFNKISDGMSKAMEERLQSERFKTELITNVSHDIKTPLTSIINYTDLLSKVEIDNENAKSYIDVLNRQSLRLKKLIEDLIEASKAASGAIKINKTPCNIATLIRQTVGEYEEKLSNANLDVITNIDDDFMILADGRRIWRVFENLLNNICKYSQENTRVYIDLKDKGDKVAVVFKNTSNYQLNMSGDELMKRFVRGDKSRHTEGSGLGLSIAKNLVDLQDGDFKIEIDGDLFKAIIEFNKV